MAAFFGLLAGIAELIAQAVRRYGFGELLFVSRDVVWMAPLGGAVLLVVLAAVLWVLGTAVRPLRRPAVVAGLGFGLAVLSVLLLFDEIHPAASGAVALGVGIQLGRGFARRGSWLRLARRVGVVAAVSLPVAAFAVPWWRAWQGQQEVAGLPAATPGRPNVLLIVLDTVRAESLSLHGYEHPTTPRLDQLANASVVFDRAFSTSPWTLPSHASMFTGLFHHEFRANWADPLESTPPTLAEVLAKNGYACGGFVANLNYCSWEVGLSRGFAHYEDHPVTAGQVVLSTSWGRALTNWQALREVWGYHDNLNRKTAARVADEFEAWRSTVEDRPWFAFLNLYDAHSPYLPPPAFDPLEPGFERGAFRYDTNLIETDDWSKLTPEQVQAERACYDGTIQSLDQEIALLLDRLREAGVLDHTVVIVTSDHGEQFGEHQLYDHGNSLYTQCVLVPLLVHYPKRLADGVRVEQAVSQRNLAATVLDLVGIEDAGGLQGHSLLRYVGDDASTEPDVVLSQALVTEGRRQGDNISVVVGDIHYIRTGDGGEELYNLKTDPLEVRDLTLTASGRDALPKLRQVIEQLVPKLWPE